MDRSSVERILGGPKGLLLTYLPGDLAETALESYAAAALPQGTEAERAEFKRYWREQIWRQRDRPAQHPAKSKTAKDWLNECKVHTKVRSQESQADKMRIERSVYFKLKAGRRVSPETYIKAANYVTAHYAPCSVDDLKPPAD